MSTAGYLVAAVILVLVATVSPACAATPGSNLEGLDVPVRAIETVRVVSYYQALDRQAQARHRSSSSGPSISGSCEAMRPAGFPTYIVWRESRSNPNVTSPDGAYGCAQLMPMHLTGDYAADWARLWDNGAGACNWNPPSYCAGR